ncbi:hypothetical protein BDW42DRAFT_120042 [Aspergillus taichungensis]|uniref:Uncharacterized protein n=1 Tax=Aspergillus taichungensis TaxID=482145 RepID=A0A2J5HRM0_9EURO|nr:hypothetical protein BDW42DRAFT_120042 [Aspergillus taichungensis]
MADDHWKFMQRRRFSSHPDQSSRPFTPLHRRNSFFSFTPYSGGGFLQQTVFPRGSFTRPSRRPRSSAILVSPFQGHGDPFHPRTSGQSPVNDAMRSLSGHG